MVELRKARATDTSVCGSPISCLGVSEWLPRSVSEQTHTRQSRPTCVRAHTPRTNSHASDQLTRIRTYPHASEPSHNRQRRTPSRQSIPSVGISNAHPHRIYAQHSRATALPTRVRASSQSSTPNPLASEHTQSRQIQR